MTYSLTQYESAAFARSTWNTDENDLPAPKKIHEGRDVLGRFVPNLYMRKFREEMKIGLGAAK